MYRYLTSRYKVVRVFTLSVVCSFSSVFDHSSHWLHFYQYFLKWPLLKHSKELQNLYKQKQYRLGHLLRFYISFQTQNLQFHIWAKIEQMLIFPTSSRTSSTSSPPSILSSAYPGPILRTFSIVAFSISSSFSNVPVSLTSRSLVSLCFYFKI